MANNKIRRADAVLWLAEQKQQALSDLRKAVQDYQAGRIALYELELATKKAQAVEIILEIFQACDIEPAELLEMLRGMRGQGRGQSSLFKQPINPM